MLRKSLGFAAILGIVASFAVSGHGFGVKKTLVHGVGWYASYNDALKEAKRTRKPILLLSMFGRLDEEMACANARTLRATLFKDPEFIQLISKDVIPAWEMVRAVPKIEIDLGDGKKIRRTVRGNAVMYLCTAEGKVFDVYPGVYTSKDFLPAVRESLVLANADIKTIRDFHTARGVVIRPVEMTRGKSMAESPTLNFIGASLTDGVRSNEGSADPARVKFLVAAARLSDMSLRPMTVEQVVNRILGKPAAGLSSNEIAHAIIQNDSQTNMQAVRPVIHLWLSSEKELPTPKQARDTVLETILKIPYKDPYFGLKDVLLPGTPG